MVPPKYDWNALEAELIVGARGYGICLASKECSAHPGGACEDHALREVSREKLEVSATAASGLSRFLSILPATAFRAKSADGQHRASLQQPKWIFSMHDVEYAPVRESIGEARYMMTCFMGYYV